MNGDGDLDLAVGNHGYVGDVNQVFENARVLPDDTLSLDITAPYTSSANFYAASVVLDSPTIPVTYTLFDPEEDRVGWIKTFYSPDGGGCWLPAVATVDTITEHLSLGSALTFDGDDDYVVVSPLVSAPSSEATVSFWMRSRDEAKTGTPLSYACSEQTNELLVFNYNNLTIYINGMSVSTGITATDGLWHHIAVAWRSSDGQIRLYKDGASVYSDTLAAGRMIHPGGALVLGQEQDSVGGGFEVMQAFSGTLDHVCMWNVMLSPVEIETNMRRAFTGNEPGLVFHWALDEGVGGMAFDRTANENDGVLGNGIEAAQPQWSNGFFATYVYTWSTFASGFFGQSDDVILRMVAYPQPAQSTITGTYKYYNSTPLYQHTYASATTFPFRVRGTQVRVYSETEHISNTVANAMVYRWSEGAGNRLLADSGGTPFRTDQHGYLQGRGEIGLGDRLLAMLPVSTVAEYAGELTFDGVDDTAFITPLNSMPIAETTVSFWINTTQGTGAPFSYASPITDATFLLTNPGDLTLWRGDTYSITTPVTVTDGLWHHLAVTWRSIDGQVKLYKDGVAAYTGTLAIDTVISPGGSLALGRDQDGGDFFKGRLDEVRIWKAVLTEDQILDEMYGLLDTNDSDLAASWSFDDPENPGTDASDNANDLTLSGATWAGDYLGGYTVYHTSGTPTTDGVDALTVSEPGVQVLTVTAQHPLVLFDLNVSLEWDAHNDPLYLQQLAVDLQRASAHLYDFTNGQVALGHVTVHQNADYWASSHIAVQATNHLRPFAHIGGLLTDIVTETVTIDGQEHTLTYGPGQIRMGATWNRYGDPTTSIGEDWPLILAHELSHYLLYQYDVYIGLNEDDLLVPQDTCTGSAMGDVYAIDNTEFISDTLHWTTACSQTLAAKTLGRTEWETLRAWYPWLITPTLANDGPSQMPFEFTTVEIVAPAQAQDTIEDPTFYLDYENGVVSSSEARAFLLRDADDVAQPGPDDFDYIYDLGSPIGGQNRVTARGARPGERLCVFDNTRAQFGCEIIAAGDERLTLKENAAWQPVIQLTPVNSTTFNIQVTGLVSEALLIKTRVYPEYGTAFTTTTLSYFPPVEGEVMGQYSGTLMLDYPAMSGHIQVWVDESASETSPRRETLVNYSIGGNPGPARAGGIGPARAGGIGPARAGGIGLLQAGEAPMVSPDGQMILYLSDVITFAEGQFFTIQTMAGLPDPPPGRTAVGPAYNLVATGFLTETPPLTGSLSIQYLGSDVLAAGVDENDLVIYFWDGSTWTVLDTVLNTPYNMASAPSQGTGIYALMAGVQTVLSGPGWNLMAYSVRGAQPVTQALLSISGYYTTVYGYEADDPDDPWKVYDVVAPEWVNDLTTLEFNHGYWINVSQTITLYLSNATALMASMLPEDSTLASPPDTFYGLLLGNTTFTPDVDMTVEARIKGTVCGRGITRAWEGQVVYVVDVFANDGVTSNCGNLGDTVMFFVAGQPMVPTAVWDNRQLNEITLKPAACVYLPLVLRVK
ncbi:MAG: hypothetical protein JXR84_03515 [Anaerolineae bacterium]|nr:hypothetical protein [Anaerolineae bacterium]